MIGSNLSGDEVGSQALGEADHGGLGRPVGKPLRSALELPSSVLLLAPP